MFLFPLVAAAVSLALAVRLLSAARRARGVALVVWSFALLQFALASGALAWGVGMGWTPGLFRVYYVFGAILNVAWLGLGTVWLLAPAAAALAATAILLAASAAAAGATATATLGPGAARALARHEVVSGREVFPVAVRNLSRIFSFAGLVVVLGGLAWSLARRRSKAAGLGLLALGVVVVFVGSELGRHGPPIPFSVGLAAGVCVMYTGFQRSR